jgi:hypothetical protein
MKRNIKISLLIVTISFFILQYGCKRSGTIEIDRYPATVGNSWKYLRTMCIVLYDTIHYDTTESVTIDSTYEEFEGIDTLAGWECFRLHCIYYDKKQTNLGMYWYAHPDSALLVIAYSLGYRCTSILPNDSMTAGNIRLKFGDMIFDSPQALAQSLYGAKYIYIRALTSDTTYMFPPSKLFVYPLEVGVSWTVTTEPGLQEREVMEEESVDVPAGTFSTLRTEINDEILSENDYYTCIWVAEEGVIKDTFYIKGEAIDSYGNIIGYFVFYDVGELLDFNIEE